MAIVQAPHTAAPLPPQTARRDTGIDFLRALCVLGVVLLHAIMVGVTVTEGTPVFDNASDGSWWIVPVSWLLQVMPMFFVIGGFTGLLAYRRRKVRGGRATAFVAGRLHRLLRPAVFTVAVIGLALAVLTVVGVPAELIAVAGFRYGQPLWFLAVFLLCQALIPVLAALHERAPYRTIGALVAASVLVDAARAVSGFDGLGFLNLAFVWMALQQLGFFVADGRIEALSRQIRIAAGVGALIALAITFATGIYSPDLIANINPPTAALLLVGVVHTSVLSLSRDRLERVSRRPLAAASTQFVTRRAMTIYLWHMPVLLAMAGASAVFALATGALLPAPGSADWWLSRPLWLVTAVALSALAAIAFTRFETQPAPEETRSAGRLFVATLLGLIGLVLLLAVGTTVSTAVIAVALLAGSLRLARRGPSASDPVPSPGTRQSARVSAP
ncbi:MULTISPECIES: acyltransferase [unclassified Microbacterium]|uniref:acyltransferase family protein n=1 Tax=unclassified Microbacterium TaxID=2609290 RepID=UPI000EA974ED|nr:MULTISPECIES: acyltransferase [unclassified Microbacterium]MBT2486116.1 acyltransferase [Microbacterium sp. ISL-108]RKN68846.1 acyltransferase [Microbacterium sp. CGR2]